MNFQLAPGESFVSCPYNKAHFVTNARILVHLDKCRRGYLRDKGSSAEIMPCPYNFAHQFPKPEYDYHVLKCPDQHTIVPHLAYHQSKEHKDKVQFAQQVKWEEDRQKASSSKKRHSEEADYGEDQERWEEDDWEKESKGYQPGYDPLVKLNQGPVIPIVPPGLTKSERKKYRLEQRIRNDEFMESIKKEKQEVEKKEIKPEKREFFYGEDDPYA